MKLAKEELLLISALETVSGVTARDCLVKEDVVSFLVKESKMGAAIGKNGKHIKHLGKRMKKRVEILPYSEKPEGFIRKSLKDVSFEEIKKEDKKMTIKCDSMNRRKLLEHNASFKRAKEFLERDYGIKEVRMR